MHTNLLQYANAVINEDMMVKVAKGKEDAAKLKAKADRRVTRRQSIGNVKNLLSQIKDQGRFIWSPTDDTVRFLANDNAIKPLTDFLTSNKDLQEFSPLRLRAHEGSPRVINIINDANGSKLPLERQTENLIHFIERFTGKPIEYNTGTDPRTAMRQLVSNQLTAGAKRNANWEQRLAKQKTEFDAAMAGKDKEIADLLKSHDLGTLNATELTNTKNRLSESLKEQAKLTAQLNSANKNITGYKAQIGDLTNQVKDLTGKVGTKGNTATKRIAELEKALSHSKWGILGTGLGALGLGIGGGYGLSKLTGNS